MVNFNKSGTDLTVYAFKFQTANFAGGSVMFYTGKPVSPVSAIFVDFDTTFLSLRMAQSILLKIFMYTD